jgi:hypothetical protein
VGELYFPAFDEFDLDTDEQNVCEYFMRRQCMFDRAQDDFEYVFSTWCELSEIREAISAEYSAMAEEALENKVLRPPSHPGEYPTIEAVMIHTPGLSMAELREQSALLRAESAAGSLMLMMDDAIQRLRHTVWDPESKTPLASEFTLGRLGEERGHAATAIWAAGNAYRHSKDWEGLVDADGNIMERHPNYSQSVRTLNILARVAGLDKIYKSSVCVATLEAISSAAGKPYIGTLWDGSLTSIGREFAERYCERDDAYERVSEALEYLSAYSEIELSFSQNPNLYRKDDD